MRRPIVERRRRGLFRHDPERILINEEERADYLATMKAAQRCPTLEAIRTALHAHAEVVGWDDAILSTAALLRQSPWPAKPDARRAGEALFKKGGGRAA